MNFIDKVFGKFVVNKINEVDQSIEFYKSLKKKQGKKMDKKLNDIRKYFTITEQIVKLHEEVGELTIECAKNDNYFNIAEELADCHVLLRQIQLFYEVDDDELQAIMKEKVDRTIKRIKEGYYEGHR